MTMQSVSPTVFLRLPAVRKRIGYSSAQIYRLEARGLFPQRVKLGTGASAWVESEVSAWQAERMAQREAREAS